MKNIILIFSLLLSCIAEAQLAKERRVYYLDASYSMYKPNGIWESVKQDLIKAINNIDDETTEIVVFPFSDSNHDHAPHVSLATEAEKNELIDWIKNYNYHDASCKTVHNLPLTDFYANRAQDDRITYMFFMTDGQNELQVDDFNSKLSRWGSRFGNKQVYGFYVMLHPTAKNDRVENIISGQQHLWLVNTADVNIRVARAETKAVFNIRCEKYVDVPVTGPTLGFQVSATTDDTDYRVTKTSIVDDKLRIYIESKNTVAVIPTEKNIKVVLDTKVPDNFSFWVTDVIDVKCLNKKERTLKITVK